MPLLHKLAVGNTLKEATANFQSAVDTINAQTGKQLMKINKRKYIHVNFGKRKINFHPVELNNKTIPGKESARYLGLNLDDKLKQKQHVKEKREDSN